MKYELLNSEGPFLLVEKISDIWYFKLMVHDSSSNKKPYKLIPTTPLDILTYIRGDWEIFNAEYETLNFLDFNSNYKNPTKIKALIKDLIEDMRTSIIDNPNLFFTQFDI